MVKVSVVISTYNQSDFINRTILSVINQTERDWELFILSDGCTDGTNEYLAKIKEPRIKVIVHGLRKGGAVRINEGFRLAKGDYHTWIASDNVYYPTAFEEMLRGLEDCDGVYTDTHYINKDDEVLWTTRRPDYCYELLLTKMCYFVGVIFMYKAECFNKLGGYNEKYLHSNDLDWWLKMGESYKVKLLPKVLGAYRDHSADNRYDGNWQVGQEFLVEETDAVLGEAITRSGKSPLPNRHIVCDDKVIRWN